MAWTEKTQQSETWTEKRPNVVGDGFSQGFAPRPYFARAFRNGIYTEKTRQDETWTAA
jgi:hypothetical protein